MTAPFPPLSPFFSYREGRLNLEEIPQADIFAETGTPAYLYSAAAFRSAYRNYLEGFVSAGLDLTICYAVKANSNLSVIRLFGELGTGADVVSGGELYRVLKAGIKPGRIVFAGVGKTASEMDYALEQNIAAFNLESFSELYLLEERAKRAGKIARVSLRLNPDVEAGTHPYITTGRSYNKFGLGPATALQMAAYSTSSPFLHLAGLQAHIGSQLLKVNPLVEAFKQLLEMAGELEKAGIDLEHLDIGGGLGVTYNEEEPEDSALLAKGIREVLNSHPSPPN